MNSVPGSTAGFLQHRRLKALVWVAGVGSQHLTTMIEVHHVGGELEKYPVVALTSEGGENRARFSGHGVGAHA